MNGNGHRPGWLAEQLPRPLAEDHFTRQFLRIFEDISGDLRSQVEGFRHFLDVRLAPPGYVRWMGGWLGLGVDPSLPEEHQRSLVMAAGPLFPWRGTRRGLQGVLEALTRAPVEIQETGGVFPEGTSPATDPHIVIRLTDTGGLNEEHLLDLVKLEVPANAMVELRVGRRKVKEAAPAEDDVPESKGEGQIPADTAIFVTPAPALPPEPEDDAPAAPSQGGPPTMPGLRPAAPPKAAPQPPAPTDAPPEAEPPRSGQPGPEEPEP